MVRGPIRARGQRSGGALQGHGVSLRHMTPPFSSMLSLSLRNSRRAGALTYGVVGIAYTGEFWSTIVTTRPDERTAKTPSTCGSH